MTDTTDKTTPVYPSGEVWYGATPEDGILAKFYGDPDLCERAAKALNRDHLFDEMAKWLEVLLPMARGYAYAHPVGLNQPYCDEAEAALARVQQAREAG